jgi:DNA-binding response OmpR family regulator
MDNIKGRADVRQILLVDGHAGVREALAHRMRHACAVTAVESMERATEVLRHLSPAAVIVDPKTVAADVDDVLSLLRRADRPLIVLTSSLGENEEARLRRAGVTAVLYKGAPFAEVLAQIEAAIGAPVDDPGRPRDGALFGAT